MSEAVAFDSHRFVKRLTQTGFTEAQAGALVIPREAAAADELAFLPLVSDG